MPRSIDFFFSFSEQSPERLNANQIGSFIQSSPSERARELQSDLGSGESSRRAVGAKQLLCGKRCHYLPVRVQAVVRAKALFLAFNSLPLLYHSISLSSHIEFIFPVSTGLVWELLPLIPFPK